MPRIRADFRKTKLWWIKYQGDRISREGYYWRWCEERGRYIGEHRFIVEAVLGRHLKRDEEVHHVNGKKSDNRKKNLVVCDPHYHRYLDLCRALSNVRKKYPKLTRVRVERKLKSKIRRYLSKPLEDT